MQMLIAGNWVDGNGSIPVINPFDNTEIDTVPRTTADDVDRAFAFALEGAKKMRKDSGLRPLPLPDASRQVDG